MTNYDASTYLLSENPVPPDLIIAGAGGGLVGALRAAQLGLKVLVIESSTHFAHGNNTSMSTAMIPGAGSRWQREVGIEDSADQFLSDIMSKTKGTADQVLANALTKVSSRLVTWLADSMGLPIELAVDFPYPGHSQFRCHTIPGRSGSLLMANLLKKVEESENIDVLVPARLVDVRLEQNHCVAIVQYPNGISEEIPASTVLLATNGFGANAEMVAKHIPEISKAVYHGSSESRGDALRIGRKLGAGTGFLDAYQGHAALSTPHSTLLGWATMMHGGVLVNSEGKRFGNETKGYSEFAKEVLAQPSGTAIAVFDRTIYQSCLLFDDFKETVNSGAVKWADDAVSLACAFNLDPAEFEATINATKTCAASGGTDEFGRSHWPHVLGEPLAGVKVTGALFHTQGGLRVDEHARVLDENRKPIANLYAAGGAAMGISGHGASGYLAGNGLLPALGLSFLAAEHVHSQKVPVTEDQN